MKQETEAIADDIRFIADEVVRFETMGREALQGLHWTEVMSDLPHPSGTGRMICGRQAYKRVVSIAGLAGEKSKLTGCVTSHNLEKETEELLVQRFWLDKRPLDEKQIALFLSAIGKAAKKKCRDTTHLIPCTLMENQNPACFSIGRVTFHNRANFKKRMRPLLRGYAKEYAQDRREFSRRLMFFAVKRYRAFDWIAEAKIEGCDDSTSSMLAERVVTSAVNFLHLCFRAQHTDRMRIGGPAFKDERSGGVLINSNGEPQPYSSWRSSGQYGFSDDWAKRLENEGEKALLRLFGVALETEANPRLNRPISRRVLDAAQWFGDAARDERPQTKLIKFVTALERMVMTGETTEISKLIATRVSALCSTMDGSDREKWRKDVLEVYEIRSDLLHGSASPYDSRVGVSIGKAARLAEQTIFSAVIALNEEALTAENVSVRRLKRWYNRVVENVEVHEK